MPEEKLVRGLGRWDLTAIAINTIIGTGIFILPARAYGLIGSYSLIALIVCAVIIGLVVLCFAEVSSRFDSTGGMYLYAKEAFGPLVGFEVGWLYWIVRVATFAANCNAMLIYIAFFLPAASEGILRVTIICIVVVGISVVNVLGVRESALMTNLFTVGKILPLLVFVAIGLFFIRPENFSLGQSPEYGSFSAAVLLLIYAFVGFEAAVIPAGESKEPRRHLPFALIAALGFCALLYLLVQTVAIGTLPGLADSKTPLADASSIFMGAFGGGFIAIGALVSVLGNLNGGFLAATRLPYAMAEHRELPGFLSRTHKRFRTPFISIIVTGAVVLVLTIWSTFFTAVAIATITRLIVYATTCGALPVFRKLKNVPEAHFRAPFGLFASVASIALIIWLLTNVDTAREGIPILIAAVAGLGVFGLNRLFRKSIDKSTSA